MVSILFEVHICVFEIADSFHLHVPGRWNSIWKLKVSPKVKNFFMARVLWLFSVTPRFPKQRNNANIIRVQHQRHLARYNNNKQSTTTISTTSTNHHI